MLLNWFEWLLPSFKVKDVSEGINFCVHFLANFSIDFEEILCTAMTCWFVNLLKKDCVKYIQKRELSWGDFI